MKIQYFLFDTTHPNFATAMSKCYKLHKASYPKNDLSLAYCKDLSQVLVKVVNDTIPVFGAELISIYDESTHIDARTLVKTDVQWEAVPRTQEEISNLKIRMLADSTFLKSVALV